MGTLEASIANKVNGLEQQRGGGEERAETYETKVFRRESDQGLLRSEH